MKKPPKRGTLLLASLMFLLLPAASLPANTPQKANEPGQWSCVAASYEQLDGCAVSLLKTQHKDPTRTILRSSYCPEGVTTAYVSPALVGTHPYQENITNEKFVQHFTQDTSEITQFWKDNTSITADNTVLHISTNPARTPTYQLERLLHLKPAPAKHLSTTKEDGMLPVTCI